MEWKLLYGKDARPRMAEILDYLTPEAAELFVRFNHEMKDRFNLGYTLPTYSGTQGWKYQYGRSGLLLIRGVVFNDGIFSVEGILVADEAGYQAAIACVEARLEDGFEARFADFCAKRSERRQARAAVRPAQPVSQRKGERLNQCKWPPMVARNKLLMLYDADMRGLPDEALLEDIGLTLYIRCKEAKAIWDHMERGAVKCMHCGQVIGYAPMIECPCGQRYTYREYRKSYRVNNMPRGEGSVVFDRYILDWERAKGYAEKMRLIDNLIHEFHISSKSGTPNRPVGVNLIQGTKAQVTALIEQLAYGADKP